MTIENQVCTLEHAKKLKELGVFADSLFYHVKTSDWRIAMKGQFNEDLWCFPAYTVAELGEMLPDGIACFKTQSTTPHSVKFKSRMTGAQSEAEARAAMLIYLLENNLVIKKNI